MTCMSVTVTSACHCPRLVMGRATAMTPRMKAPCVASIENFIVVYFRLECQQAIAYKIRCNDDNDGVDND